MVGLERRDAGAVRRGRRIPAMLVALPDLRTLHDGDRRSACPAERFEKGH
jgi:hypothetical protein